MAKKNKAASAAAEKPAEEVQEATAEPPSEAETETPTEASVASASPEFGTDSSVIEELLKDDDDDLDEPTTEVSKPPAADVAPEGTAEPADATAPPAEEPLEQEAAPAEAATPVVPAETLPTEPVPLPSEVKPPEQATPETPPEVLPATPELTTEQLEERYVKWRGDTEGIIAERYAFTDEMADELDTDARKFMPQLMAKVYVDAVTATVGHIVANMPALLESTLKSRDTREKAEGDFFLAWPQLNMAEHGEVVSRFGIAYRQLNPGVSTEEFIRDVGAQAMVALKIPVEASTTELPPAEPVVPAPFRPAATTPPAGGPQTPANPFTALSETFEDLELDLDNAAEA